MIAKISHNGQTSYNLTTEQAVALGYTAEVISAELLKSAAHDRRLRARDAIADGAGDVSTLLGTTADATHLLLYGVASLVAKLATANSLAEVREAAAPFAVLSGAFLAKVADGSVRLPMMAKPLESVVADIEGSATAVADAIASVSAPVEG